MTQHDVTFILELLTNKTEQMLRSKLALNPHDKEIRAVYADFLKEAGRDESARMIERGYTPGGGWSSDLSSGAIRTPSYTSGYHFDIYGS